MVIICAMSFRTIPRDMEGQFCNGAGLPYPYLHTFDDVRKDLEYPWDCPRSALNPATPGVRIRQDGSIKRPAFYSTAA